MSIAHGRARLVHRHDGVAVAADPAAVAERLVQRLAEHDPRVLDRVVRARLQVAGDLHVEVQPAVAGEQVEHVVEEADAGGAGAGAGAGQAERQGDVGLAGLAGRCVGGPRASRATGDSRPRAPSRRRGPGSPRPRRSARRRRASAAAASPTRTSAIRRRKWRTLRPEAKRAAPSVGQRVVRTRDVVAERGAGGVADEQAAGGAHARRQRLRGLARELQVLGRERLGEGQRGLHVVGEHLAPAAVERRRGSPGRR